MSSVAEPLSLCLTVTIPETKTLLRCPLTRQLSLRVGAFVTVLSSSVFCFLGLTSTCGADDVKSKKVLLLSQSPDGHPRMTHEYTAGLRVLERCLSSVSGVEVTHVNANSPWPDGPKLIRDADCVVMFLSEGARWTHEEPRRIEAFAQLAARGGAFFSRFIKTAWFSSDTF